MLSFSLQTGVTNILGVSDFFHMLRLLILIPILVTCSKMVSIALLVSEIQVKTDLNMRA